MTRRLGAALAAVAFIIVACGGPAAPALTDPKEILTQSLISHKDVKTVEATGNITGNVKIGPGAGTLPLEGTTFTAAVDIGAENVRFALDAPSLLGTKVEAIVVDRIAYTRLLGGLAMFFPSETGDKFTRTELPAPSGDPSSPAPDFDEAMDEIVEALDKLPVPTKQPDERCGDADCYRLTLALSTDQLESLGTSAPAGLEGTTTIDIWSRKDNLRPARVVMSADGGEMGTATATIEFRYDGAVTIEAPPDDEVASP
jgi:hypothetical protein